MIEMVSAGFSLLVSHIWLVPLGVLIGMFVGALPGLSSSGTLAMMLPIFMSIPPEQGVILAVAIYIGAEMGNSFPSVMLNIPGTGAGAVTAFDGYPMMKKGLASQALGICIMASTIGAVVGGIATLTLAPALGAVALRFGPAEIVIVVLFGMAMIAVLSSESIVKGLLAGFLGLLIAITGTDPTFGARRGTFDIVYLFDTIPLIAVLVGLLGFSELLKHAEQRASTLVDPESQKEAGQVGMRGIFSGFGEALRRPVELIRSSLIGVGIGSVPGAGGSVATFVAYQQSMAFASEEERKLYGKGSKSGLTAADACNNAMVGGALIPTLTLAIPGSGTMAVIIVIMSYHGLYVGPRLFEMNGDIAYAVLWSQFFAAISVLFVGTLLASFAHRVALIKLQYIVPVVALFCLLGAYARHNYVFDMGVMLLFGAIGYLMKKQNYPVVALLLGVILGPMFEENFMRALRLSRGSADIFYSSTLSQVLWTLLFVTFLLPPIVRAIKRRRLRREANA